MEKKYKISAYMRDARPRSKRLRDLGVPYSPGLGSTVIINNPSGGSAPSADSTKYLSKTKDDAANGHITFNNGTTIKGKAIVDDIQSTGYQETVKAGFRLYTDANGRGVLDINKVLAEELIVDVLTYNKIQAIGGTFILSKAWAKVSRFTISESGVVRIYYKPDLRLQMWRVGYQAYMVNAGRMFWGVVTAISDLVEADEHWFECDATEEDVDYVGTKNFRENDEFVLRGSRRTDDPSAQTFLVLTAATDTPTIASYSLVDSFVINDNNLNYQFGKDVIIKKATGNVNLAEDLDRIEGLVDTDSAEYIYALSATSDQDDLPELTNSTTDKFVPTGWYDNMQSVTTAKPYQFRATRTKDDDGAWGNFGSIILNNSMGLNGADGANGQDGTDGQDGKSAVPLYALSTTKPSIPSAVSGVVSPWSKTTPSNATVAYSMTHGGSWALKGGWYKSPSISDSGYTEMKITITATTATTVRVFAHVSSEAGYDYLWVGRLNISSATSSPVIKIAGNGVSDEALFVVPSGTSTIICRYSKDGTGSNYDDAGYIAVSTSPEVWVSMTEFDGTNYKYATPYLSGGSSAPGLPGTKGEDGVVPDSVMNSLKDDLAHKMGYTGGYDDLVDAAESGETIISGGHLRTSLIESESILAGQINGDGLTATNATITGTITATNGKIGGFSIVGDEGTLTEGNALLPKISNVFFDFMKLGFTKRDSSINISTATTCNYQLEDGVYNPTAAKYVFLDAAPAPQVGMISSNSFVFFLTVVSNHWFVKKPLNADTWFAHYNGFCPPGVDDHSWLELHGGLNILVYNELTYTWFLMRAR